MKQNGISARAFMGRIRCALLPGERSLRHELQQAFIDGFEGIRKLGHLLLCQSAACLGVRLALRILHRDLLRGFDVNLGGAQRDLTVHRCQLGILCVQNRL